MKNVDSKSRIMDSGSSAGAIGHLSFVIIFCLLFLLSAATSLAQSSNRWLFVFNTSASMRDRTNGMQAVTQDLLTTGMHGTIRAGDTIGIWTYNSELHADEAPLQTWTPNTAPAIAYNTVLFLQQHRYEKSAAFDDVRANMLRVIKMSDTITVILISDGADAIRGTPFDAQLTAYYKTNYQSQKKAHMPVVTLLRGEKGVVTTNTLALAPWPVDIPAVPAPEPVKTAAAKPEPVLAPAAPKPVPSLVIIGKKAETTYSVPTDLPDHSGDLPAQPAATAPQTETVPLTAKAETAPEPTPAAKVDETLKTTVAPAAAATAPAQTVAEPPKAVQQTEPQPAAAPKEPTVAKSTDPVEAAAPVPQKELFSTRNIAIVSIVFTLLVCVLLILSARNARRMARASLITRSLDRERQ